MDVQKLRVLEQKLMGVVMLIITVFVILMCKGTNEDCGAVFITAPLGLLFLFSKQTWIV